MTKALPFTEALLARGIKGVEKAGRYVVGVKVSREHFELIVADKPANNASFAPPDTQTSPAAERRRMGDYFHGGSSEA
jgi:hypothetical protein